MRKTYQEIATFDGQARQWIAQHPEKTKFSWAVNRVLKRSQAIVQDYREKAEDLTIKHCSVDDKGNILTDGIDQFGRERYKFTPDKLLKRNEEQRALFKTEVEIEPYIATEEPKEISEEDRELFEDFVLNGQVPE